MAIRIVGVDLPQKDVYKRQEDGILIGTVAMIMVMLCWKTAKSVNI